VITSIGNEHVATTIHRYSVWFIQTRARAEPPITAETGNTVPRHRRDGPHAHIQSPDALIALVGDEHFAATIHRYSEWSIQTHFSGNALINVETGHTVPRHRRDYSCLRGQFTDAVVARVGDEHVAAAVHCHSEGELQTRPRGEFTVTAEIPFFSRPPIPRNRRDDSLARVQFTDTVITSVGYEHVAAPVHRHSKWRRQTRARARPPISSGALLPVSSDSCYEPRARVQFTNAVIDIVGNVNIA